MQYADGKSLFLGPQITQYDNHMVMTNVSQPTKRKYINLDTVFRDEYSDYDPYSVAVCTITLPERINNVKSVIVRNMEIPITFYNISDNIGNNCFQIVVNGTKGLVVVPNGEYTASTLYTAINDQIGALAFGFHNLHLSGSNYKTTVQNVDVSNSYMLHFDIADNGGQTRYDFKRSLGWLGGFRNKTYTVARESAISSEGIYELTTSRYLYLIMDEFVGSAPNSFIAPRTTSLIQKNILARIAINRSSFGFGSWLIANNFNGLLLSDRRTYSGKVDFQKTPSLLPNSDINNKYIVYNK